MADANRERKALNIMQWVREAKARELITSYPGRRPARIRQWAKSRNLTEEEVTEIDGVWETLRRIQSQVEARSEQAKQSS